MDHDSGLLKLLKCYMYEQRSSDDSQPRKYDWVTVFKEKKISQHLKNFRADLYGKKFRFRVS